MKSQSERTRASSLTGVSGWTPARKNARWQHGEGLLLHVFTNFCSCHAIHFVSSVQDIRDSSKITLSGALPHGQDQEDAMLGIRHGLGALGDHGRGRGSLCGSIHAGRGRKRRAGGLGRIVKQNVLLVQEITSQRTSRGDSLLMCQCHRVLKESSRNEYRSRLSMRQSSRCYASWMQSSL